MGLEIKLTGSVTVHGGRTQCRHLSSSHAEVAMVRLTMERRRGGTTRDQLADTLWPEGLPNTWASALRSVVSRVRAFVASALPPGSTPLVAEAGRYVLHLPDDAVVDLERAEAAVVDAKEALAAGSFADARMLASAAATCLRTPFLPDHDGVWVADMRHRLGDLLVTGLETASLASSALGDHGEALGFANEAIRRAPLRESAHRCRMTAHVTAGNRAEALRTYQELRRTLAEELGVDPAPETEAAYLDLLGTPAPAASDASLETVATGGGSPLRPGSSAPFVGRHRQLAMLAQAWVQAERKLGHMVLVTGEPGVGKTRLVTEAAHRIAVDGGLVLGGRCDRGAVAPCQPFVEAIGGYLAATPDDCLPGLSATRREQLVAAVRSLTSGDPAPPDRPWARSPASSSLSPRSRSAPSVGADMLGALAEVLVGAARDRPILLVLDDIHLADPDTLVLLRRVCSQCAGTPLLVVATAIDQLQRSGTFAEVVQDLERHGWLHRLPLRGLDEADVRALTRHMLADTSEDGRPAPHRLIGDSGGNPFLLLQLLHTLRGDARSSTTGRISTAIDEYAAARLDVLTDAERDLLWAATVFGGSFELDLAAQAAGLSPATALDAVDSLLAGGLLAEVGDALPSRPSAHRYRFTHDVVRQALYDQLSDARRRRLHSGAADAIERLGPDGLADYTLTVAHHRAAGATRSGDSRAARWGLAAAAYASQGRAPNEAIRLYHQALDHMALDDHALRAQALTELGLAQKDAGRPGSEQTLLDGAIQARRCGLDDVEARAALGLADVSTSRPQLRKEAEALVDEVLERAASGRPGRGSEAGSEPGAADGSGSAGVGAGAIDDLTLARLVARQAQMRGRIRPAPGVTTAALEVLGRELHLAVGPDQVERRLDLARDLQSVASVAGDSRWQVLAAHHRAMAVELAGDVVRRDEALAALASATGDGHLLGDALLADHSVALGTTQGRFADAAAAAELAGVLSGDVAHGIAPVPGAMAARQMLVAGWMRGPGRLPARAGAGRGPDALAYADDRVEQALVAIAEGDRGRAHLVVRSLATGAEPLPSGDAWPHAAGLLGLAAAELGDTTTAEAVRTLLMPYADLTCGAGYRSFVGPMALHLGRLASVVGDWAEAERHFTSALRQLAARRARPWIALTQIALARTLSARGRPGDRRWAAALRSDAKAIVTALGLQPRWPVRVAARDTVTGLGARPAARL
jgi:DNA-binding SARP family transcriptional activator